MSASTEFFCVIFLLLLIGRLPRWEGAAMTDTAFASRIGTARDSARQDWIARARSTAAAIALRDGRVTIDDVRLLCPPPEGADPRIMGTVFSCPGFVRLGYEPSSRLCCHGRPIGVFTIRSR